MIHEYDRGYPVHNIQPETTTNLKISYSGKLNVFNWLSDVPKGIKKEEIYEIRFKNTRKGYFYNTNGLRLEIGDIVAVEASPGHDIGIISLKGHLVLLQLRKQNISPSQEFKAIYRKAKPNDIEKWKESINMEAETMIKSRQIAADLKLNMKIGDVEYQGDKTKAIFYYIADDRVDFRELIKVLADRFRIRIEMRQIGARQEAGRIGGIGPCGRELCCSTWISNFVSVTTNSARFQELSLNPQKLAGQCSKLKCCLNYEIDSYMDKRKDFPPTDVRIHTSMGEGTHIKTDVYRGVYWYVMNKDNGTSIVPMAVERVAEVIEQNRNGNRPVVSAEVQAAATKTDALDFANVVGQESLTRFDDNSKKNRHPKSKKRHKPQHRRNENTQD